MLDKEMAEELLDNYARMKAEEWTDEKKSRFYECIRVLLDEPDRSEKDIWDFTYGTPSGTLFAGLPRGQDMDFGTCYKNAKGEDVCLFVEHKVKKPDNFENWLKHSKQMQNECGLVDWCACPRTFQFVTSSGDSLDYEHKFHLLARARVDAWRVPGQEWHVIDYSQHDPTCEETDYTGDKMTLRGFLKYFEEKGWI